MKYFIDITCANIIWVRHKLGIENITDFQYEKGALWTNSKATAKRINKILKRGYKEHARIIKADL